jgi:hypothetical protein
MHVYVNGKLYNQKADRLIRVRSQSGLFHLEIKVYHPDSRKWYSLTTDIRTERGIECCYSVQWTNGIPRLTPRGRYPIYSRYFLNPSLYNKHPVS